MLTRDEIDKAYRDLGNEKGWTFMACPEARLRSAEVAIVGTNPGGGGPKDSWVYGGIWSCEKTDDFAFDGDRMRPQIEAWHDLLGVARDATFCAQYVPFRSPGWSDLPRKSAALAFARRLWAPVLELSPASLFVTMGKVPGRQLATLMDAGPTFAQLYSGWGDEMIEVYVAPNGRSVVAMPHPSRYPLFGRGAESELAEQHFKAATGRV